MSLKNISAKTDITFLEQSIVAHLEHMPTNILGAAREYSHDPVAHQMLLYSILNNLQELDVALDNVISSGMREMKFKYQQGVLFNEF